MSDDDSAYNVAGGSTQKSREQHNNSERRRRDTIKDAFTALKETVPSIKGDKSASRTQILKKASEFIQHMESKNKSHRNDIDNLNRQNNLLEYQIKQLKKFKASGIYYTLQPSDLVASETDSSDKSEDELQKSKNH